MNESEGVPVKADESEPRWCDVAESQYDLGSDGTTVGRTLLYRICTPDGLDYQGHPEPWRIIANFKSYNDAHRVLSILRAKVSP